MLYHYSKEDKNKILSFGIVADLHYADKDPEGDRCYRESVGKLRECVSMMNRKGVDFLIELGDFKDQDAPPQRESTIRYLQAIERIFSEFNGMMFHVLGNHDMDSISKPEFLSMVTDTGIQRHNGYYSFDVKGVHFVVLDANYTGMGRDYDSGNFDWRDSNLPENELEWLDRDLELSTEPVVVFIHQRLDTRDDYSVNNSSEVLEVLRKHNCVTAVFQGHSHTGSCSSIEGIYFYTLKGMVEGSGRENSPYAVVDVIDYRNIRVTGYNGAVTILMSPESG